MQRSGVDHLEVGSLPWILAAVVEGTSDFIGVCDPDLKPIFVNRAGREMVGLPDMDAVRNSHVMEYFWPEDLPLIEREALPALREHGEWVGAVRFRHFQSGAPIYTRWNVMTVRNPSGDLIGYATVSPNLDELEHARRALEDATVRLRTELQEKDRFLAVLGHELRNPLSALQNAIAVSREGQDVDRPAMMAVIERSANQLRSLVDDLVDLARVRAGGLSVEPRPVDLSELLRHVAEEHRPSAQSRRVALRVSVPERPAYADLDRPRMRQVLSNLIANAFRATPPGGSIDLRLERRAGELVLAVEDSGVGIPPGDLESIFDAFDRGTPSGDTDGLGLGLTIARSLVEAHGGTLTAESEGRGRGARFVLTLPARAPSEEKRGERLATCPTTCEIVLIDDHRDHADVLAILLETRGHRVTVAYDGNDGIDRVAEVQPDVVIIDIGLPGMTGFDVARAIRERPWGGGMLLIAHTGYADDATVAAARTAGFDAHFAKPLKLDEFERLLAGRLDSSAP